MTIMESTIIPFYERVENCNETSLAKLSIPQREFQLSYQAIFHLCGQCSEEDYSQKFYLKHTQLLEDYCESAIINHLYQTPSLKGSSQLFLIDWVECWRKYCWVVDGLQRVFQYIVSFSLD